MRLRIPSAADSCEDESLKNSSSEPIRAMISSLIRRVMPLSDENAMRYISRLSFSISAGVSEIFCECLGQNVAA